MSSYQLNIEIPKGFDVKLSEKDLHSYKVKARALYLAKAAEYKLIKYFEKEFNVPFTTGTETEQGYDIKSEDGSIKIEVKTCSAPTGKYGLRAQKFDKKVGACNYIAVVDLYGEPRVAVIDHDDFFDQENFTKCNSDIYDTWAWNLDYTLSHKSDKRNRNTQQFLDNEIKL